MSQSEGSNTDMEDLSSLDEKEALLKQELEKWGLSSDDAEQAAHLARLHHEAKDEDNPIADAIDA